MATAENKEVVRRLIALWSEGDLAAIEELLSPEFLNHNPNLPYVTDRLSLIEWAAAMRAAYPNLRIAVDELIGEGDTVAARLRVRGTPAVPCDCRTPRPFAIDGIVFCRIVGARIIEAWWVLDIFTMFRQIGVMDREVVA
jgi:predicted SnoaL-like aldol condensation-catalyzing enzyme